VLFTVKVTARTFATAVWINSVFLKPVSADFQRSITSFEGRKYVMEGEFYWQSLIYMYQLKFAWRYLALIIRSLIHADSQFLLQSRSFLTVVKSVNTARLRQG
jgi:hypothetical protein